MLEKLEKKLERLKTVVTCIKEIHKLDNVEDQMRVLEHIKAEFPETEPAVQESAGKWANEGDKSSDFPLIGGDLPGRVYPTDSDISNAPVPERTVTYGPHEPPQAMQGEDVDSEAH